MLTIAGDEVADGGELTGTELSPADPSPVLIISRVEDASKPTARLVTPHQR